MEENAQDLEEVVLFPDMALPIADRDSISDDELLAELGDEPLSALRDWLALQLAQLEGQIRKQGGLSKPSGLTPDLNAYIQARENHAARKASKDAYMKALQKLDQFDRAKATPARN